MSRGLDENLSVLGSYLMESSNDATAQGGARTATYRITGELAHRRIAPLLQSHPVNWVPASEDAESVDWVWETHVPRQWKEVHDKAKVLNRLLHSTVLENKANFALIQDKMQAPTLQTYILRGDEVAGWAQERWGRGDTTVSSSEISNDDIPSASGASNDGVSAAGVGEAQCPDWWVLKATGANGGSDVFVFHSATWRERVLPRVMRHEVYVVQRYVCRPLLYHGRKFHFRCYALLTGDLRAYLYKRAYILAASNPFSLSDSDDLTHLTNLSVNKVVEGYPGEIPTTLPEEYPTAWGRMREVWADTVRAAAPYMAVQASRDHFEFVGLDFIVDESGTPWLIEANRLPGITSSKQNQAEEDRFFDGMVQDMLGLCVLPPLTGTQPTPGHWDLVNEEACKGFEVEYDGTQGWKNVLRFGMLAARARRSGKVAVSSVGDSVTAAGGARGKWKNREVEGNAKVKKTNRAQAGEEGEENEALEG